MKNPTHSGKVLALALALLCSSSFAAILNYTQVTAYAYEAGFRGEDLAVAVAIAYAESRFKTDAVGDNGWSKDLGLWQINDYYNPMTKVNAFNPQKNANKAFEVYNQNGGSFANRWATYDDGLHVQYLAKARPYAANLLSWKDINRFATSDSRFIGRVNSILTQINNWTDNPDYYLRGVQFKFDPFLWWLPKGKIMVWEYVNKTNLDDRAISFYDPDMREWTSWYRQY